MLDSEAAWCYYDRNGSETSLLFVPLTPGATALHTRITSALPEDRRRAVDELAGIGELLHELIGVEEEPPIGFRAMPREYQDWIASLISLVLVRLHRDSRLRP